MGKKIVGIISGGLDSVAFAASRMKEEDELYALTFDYGQKASREIPAVWDTLGDSIAKHKVLDITFMKDLYPHTQLTDEGVKVESSYTPSVVVPIRNAIFLTIGMAYAMSIGAEEILSGSHLGDITLAGDGEYFYPDCSPIFTKALQEALHMGHFKKAMKPQIINPALLNMTKSDVILLGYPILKDRIFLTWSCYHSKEKHCGECESCRNRKKAFEDVNIKDLTEYE